MFVSTRASFLATGGLPLLAAGVTFDQERIYRPQGAAPDIGAFELQLPPVVVSVQRHSVGAWKSPSWSANGCRPS